MDVDLGTGGSAITRMRMRKGGVRCTELALGFMHLAALRFPPAHNPHPRLEPLLLRPKPPPGTKTARNTDRLAPSSARRDATFGRWGLRRSSRSKKAATARLAGETGAPCAPTDTNTLLPSDSTVIGLCHRVLRELYLE